jgi:hypothetical protein
VYCARVTGVLLDEWHDMFQSLTIIVPFILYQLLCLGATASQQRPAASTSLVADRHLVSARSSPKAAPPRPSYVARGPCLIL